MTHKFASGPPTLTMVSRTWILGTCAVVACAADVSAFAPSSAAVLGLRRGSAQCGVAAPAANFRRNTERACAAAPAESGSRIAEIEEVAHPEHELMHPVVLLIPHKFCLRPLVPATSLQK